MLPMRIGEAEKRTRDYKRQGTTTLFDAPEIVTGHVTGAPSRAEGGAGVVPSSRSVDESTHTLYSLSS